MRSLPVAFPYQGSKRKLAPLIVPHLPRGTRVLELFAASAAISIAQAHRDPRASFLLNDLNGPLMGIWSQILDDPAPLAEQYRRHWEGQGATPEERSAYFNVVRDRFNTEGDPGDLLFLLYRIVKGAVRYNAQGDFNQSPDKRRRGTEPHKVTRALGALQALMSGRATVTATDFRELLEDVSPDDVVYLDPPYQGVSKDRDGRYLAGLSYSDFCSALEPHIARGLRFVISYDGSTGERTYGDELPEEFGFVHLKLDAGTSASSTLQGTTERTIESLYVTPSLLSETAQQLALVS